MSISSMQRWQAQSILDRVEPEPSGQYPSASQLIGTSLDFLDRWFAVTPHHPGLARVKVPAWGGAARKVANDLLGVATKGRAYRSLDSLIIRHGGRALVYGAALLIAAALEAIAASEQRDFTEVSVEYLPSESPGTGLGRSAVPGSAFGPAAEAAVAQGIDPPAPEIVQDLIELAFAQPDPHRTDPALDVIHDYLHFRLETGDDPDGWNAAHQAYDELLEYDDSLMPALQEKLGQFEDSDEHQRWSVMKRVPIVAAVG